MSNRASSGLPRSLIRGLAWDIGLNASIPLACYYLTKRFVSPSEFTALVAATGFPVLKSLHDLWRHRELDPVAVLVLLGIVTSMAALFVGGDPRVLLVRESLVTGAFGITCLVSLLFPRPLMFYFGRPFMTGGDPEKRKAYDERWRNPIARRGHRLITIVWGLVFTGEFVLRVAMVYSLPSAIVLGVSPFLMGGATIITIIWTFRYAFELRQRTSPE